MRNFYTITFLMFFMLSYSQYNLITNYTIEDVKATIHWKLHVPFEESGDLWLLRPDGTTNNLQEGIVLGDYSVGPESVLVYPDTD